MNHETPALELTDDIEMSSALRIQDTTSSKTDPNCYWLHGTSKIDAKQIVIFYENETANGRNENCVIELYIWIKISLRNSYFECIWELYYKTVMMPGLIVEIYMVLCLAFPKASVIFIWLLETLEWIHQ